MSINVVSALAVAITLASVASLLAIVQLILNVAQDEDITFVQFILALAVTGAVVAAGLAAYYLPISTFAEHP